MKMKHNQITPELEARLKRLGSYLIEQAFDAFGNIPRLTTLQRRLQTIDSYYYKLTNKHLGYGN